jgi:hypothetical protein
MVVELVLFDLPPGTTRANAAAMYRKTAEKWLANPDLVQKYYFFDPAGPTGGGVYVWRNRAAVQRWHGKEYARMVQDLYGAAARTQIFDAVMHVDPVDGRINEF